MKTLNLSDEDYAKLIEVIEIAHYYAEDLFDGHRNCDDGCSKYGPIKEQADLVEHIYTLIKPVEYDDGKAEV